MGCTDLIRKLASLPADRRAEVLDFVELLSQRAQQGAATHADWEDAEFRRLAIEQALRGLEDETVACGRDDLKERWQ
jgi:hypothetical protein